MSFLFFFSDYSPLNMASHPSFRGGLISSSNQITLSSTTTAISLFILLLMHHRIWANFFFDDMLSQRDQSLFWGRILIFMKLWVYEISSELLKVLREILKVPKFSSYGIHIPNGCKHFKLFLQLFNGNEANSNKPLKNLKTLWNYRLVLPFPDTEKYRCLLLLHKHQSIH